MVNGYFVWRRNEHFTLKAGALEHPWRKKEDETTGRWYFKNVDKKTTQWVDPRSHEHRPHDALETKGDDLPYGWDEAETEDGVTFYINHLTNTHHKEHPRVQLQKKKSQYARKEQESAEIAEKHLTVLKDLRSKRRRIQAMLVEVGCRVLSFTSPPSPPHTHRSPSVVTFTTSTIAAHLPPSWATS